MGVRLLNMNMDMRLALHMKLMSQKMEELVMSWAAENPEPVYPSWGTWLAAKFGYDLCEIMYEPIPADIAQKLGIEPKEDV